MTQHSIIFILFTLSLFSLVNSISIGLNQYEYMKRREYLKNYELQFRKAFTLNSQENVVNLYLKYLKSKEFISTKDYFYPARPIEKELTRVQNTDIYKLLKKMPKGGNLHYHEYQGLDRGLIIDIIMNSPEYEMFYICETSACGVKYRLTYFKYPSNATNGWTKVKGSTWTKDEIVKRTTLAGILNSLNMTVYPTDSAGRWNLTGDVFGYYDDVITYNTTRYQYLQKILDTALYEENTQIIEFRRSISKTPYYFSDNGTKIFYNIDTEMNILRTFKENYAKQNPKFIDYIFLMYATRSNSKQSISDNIESVLKLQGMHTDMIRGYDLVGEEDLGHTLLFHVDSLMKLYNKTFATNGTLKLYFHTAETSWPEDNEPSQFGDEVSTNENVFDSLVLETKRIGHGLGFAKHPALLTLLKERDIAIELCPASNQILGYTPDLRNHPGIHMYRGGVPIVLAGDDPGTFGYNELTVEYYLVAMAWGLDLSEMKQIAFNSVQYSAIPDDVKASGIGKFNDLWNNVFIKEQYSTICNMKFNTNFNISGVLPTFGPYDRSSNVSVFGYGFENAFCKDIICQFGSYNTTGSFHDYHEIHCPTPVVQSPEVSVRLKLSVNNQVIDTGYDFKYVDIADDSTSFGFRLGSTKTTYLISIFFSFILLHRF